MSGSRGAGYTAAMHKFDVWIRNDLDELKSARLEAAGMPVTRAGDAGEPPREDNPLTTIVRVAAQSEAMARAQVAAVIGTSGQELRVYSSPA